MPRYYEEGDESVPREVLYPRGIFERQDAGHCDGGSTTVLHLLVVARLAGADF